MAFLVTTTGSLTPVVLADLGIQLDHPVNDRNLESEFDIETLKNSSSIASNMAAGHLTVKDADGNVLTDPSDLEKVTTPHNIGSHLDATVAGVADTNVLKYVATSELWEPAAVEASEVGYDNSASSLAATDVQAALDEIEARVDVADDYAGKFEQATITTTEIPSGKWGWWWDTVNLKMFNVRNRSGVLYSVEANPI